MRRKEEHRKDNAEKAVREIRGATRRRFAAEEKIRIVLEGLRGEESIAEALSGVEQSTEGNSRSHH